MSQQFREPQIRAAVLAGITPITEMLELDLPAAMNAANLDPGCLNEPERKLPVANVSQLLEHIAQHSNCSDVGLRLSQSVHLGRLGLIGLLVQGRRTVGEAFQAVAGFSQLHNEALHLWVEGSGARSLLRLEYLMRTPIPARQMIELSAGVIVRNLRAIIDEAWAPQRVSFRHSARESNLYRQVFGCPVQFDADLDGMYLLNADLGRDNRLRQADPADYLTRARQLSGSAGPAATARLAAQLILTLLASGDCSAQRVAGLMGCNRRTLHRHLAAQGLNFSQLLNSVRRELAARHVRLGSRRLADIAQLLGFKSQSDFSHWFRAEFDTSPSCWRLQ